MRGSTCLRHLARGHGRGSNADWLTDRYHGPRQVSLADHGEVDNESGQKWDCPQQVYVDPGPLKKLDVACILHKFSATFYAYSRSQGTN